MPPPKSKYKIEYPIAAVGIRGSVASKIDVIVEPFLNIQAFERFECGALFLESSRRIFRINSNGGRLAAVGIEQ